MHLFEAYKNLRAAEDLNKTQMSMMRLYLSKTENGKTISPTDSEIHEYLNNAAAEGKIAHYTLKGPNGDLFLFEKDFVEKHFKDIVEYIGRPTTVIPVGLPGSEVSFGDLIPPEISQVGNLYKAEFNGLTPKNCVYFLCRDKKVVYVGQSCNLYNRLSSHTKDKTFDNVFYIRVAAKDMDLVEKSLIYHLSPFYNKENFKYLSEFSDTCNKLKVPIVVDKIN